MKTPPTNLRVLRRTRRKPEAGDIFAFQLEQFPDRFFFGRVVAVNTKIGGLDGNVILIYLYKASSPEKTKIPPLNLSELLVPPLGTNTLPWTRGFFEVVKSNMNTAGTLFPHHCFRDYRGWYFDEYGNRLSDRIEPVGEYGLAGIGAIDSDISKALGLDIVN
jgi:hypothetical protein